MQRREGYIPVVAQDAAGGDAVSGMIPPGVSKQTMSPLELATTVKESEQYTSFTIDRDVPSCHLAFEARAKMVLEQVGDGSITTVVAMIGGPPAVAEATEPATILLFLTIDLPEEREEGLLGRLLEVGGSSDGADGRMKSGMVGGIELGPKTGEIKAEVSSRGIRS